MQFHSTMPSQYSLAEIVQILDQIIEPVNQTALIRATKLLQTLQKCQNFPTQFLQLIMHPQLNESHKLLVLSAIRQHLQSIHHTKPITLSFIDSIFAIWNSCQAPVKCKEVLLHMMSSLECFTSIKQDIARIILQRIDSEHLGIEDYYIIYVSQFILESQQNWIDNINYLLSMNQHHIAIAKHIMLPTNNHYEELGQVVELFKIITGKLKYAALEEKQTYLNSQISDFLLQCLELTQIEQQDGIKTQIFQLLSSIYSITCHYLEQTSFFVRTISLVPRVVNHIINFLSRHETKVASRKNSVQICVSLLNKIYGNINLIAQTKGIYVHELIHCLIQSITLKSIHYDHFHFNPTEFLNFIHSVLQIQKVKSQPNMLDHSDSQEELGLPKRRDGKSYLNNNKVRTNKQQEDEYFHICELIEIVCCKSQPIGVELLKSIVDTLTNGVSFDGLPRTTSWILLGLLKREVVKRRDIMQSVRHIILTELFVSSVPTVNSEQPENMQFTIALAVAQKYFDVIFEDNENNSILFGLLIHIVEGRKREESLVCLAVDILKQFAHNAEYFASIITVFNEKIESSDSQVILVQILGFHQQLMSNCIVFAADAGKEFHIMILLISSKVEKWMMSQKLIPVTFSALQLLFEYKRFLNSNPSFPLSRERYNQLIEQLRRIRCIINIWKDGTLRSTFDSLFISLFCKEIEMRNRIQSERQEVLLLAIIDYNTANRAIEFIKEGKQLLQLMINKPHAISDALKKRMPEVLIIILQGAEIEDFSEILFIAQSYMVLEYSSLDVGQHQRLLACISEHIGNLWEVARNVMGSWLTIRIAVYLAIPHLEEPHSFVQKLIANSTALSSSHRTNQISIYLISILMQNLITDGHQYQILDLLHLVIALIDSTRSDQFQDRMTNQSNEKEGKNNQKLQIDQWSPLKSLIWQLRQLGLWQQLRDSLSGRECQVLRQSLLCCNMQKQTRIIYKIQFSNHRIEEVSNMVIQ